jgi:Protein of unknown function (DUF3306)
MTEPGNFLSRWARRKYEAEVLSGAQSRNSGTEPTVPPQPDMGAEPGLDVASLDLESLPSVESITENTDIRSFLTSGVPAELTRAALRRVWTSDPAIRDFIGIAENQWDFNDPNAIPGFGPLGGTDDVPALLMQALGRADRTADAIPNLAIPPLPVPTAVIASCDDLPKQPPSEILPPVDPTVSARDPAGEDAAAAMPSSVTAVNGDTRQAKRRLHGSALPR